MGKKRSHLEEAWIASVPEAVEEVVLERLKGLLGFKGEGALPPGELKRLSCNVKELSDYFTKRRCDRPDLYLKKGALMAAYLAYFLPSNILKTWKPLTELALHPGIRLGQDGDIDLLDLGCGPGTATIGIMNFFLHSAPCREGTRLKVTAVDNTAENLDEAALVIKMFWERVLHLFAEKNITGLDFKSINADLLGFDVEVLANKRFDLIVLSNSLGELGKGDVALPERTRLIESLAEKCLKESGSIIIIEPALRGSSRELLALREGVVNGGAITIYSPCLACDSCGALENKRDWCHEAFGWDPPHIVKEIDRMTGFDKSHLKYSYLVLRKDGLSMNDLYPDVRGELFRVVSDMLVMKGESRLFLCGKRGRVQLGRLDRDSSESNRIFDRLKKGDTVGISGIYKKGDILRIGKESAVELP